VTVDPSTAPSRTELSWQRTGLGLAALAAVLLKIGVSRGAPLEIAAAALALLTSAAVLALLPRMIVGNPALRFMALSAVTVAVLIVEVLAVAGAFAE
jgi:putative membrane protein